MTKGFTNISWQCRSSLQPCWKACSLVSTCTYLFSPSLCFLGTATVLSIMIPPSLFLAVILITLLFPLFAPNSCSHEQIIQPSKLSFQHSVWTSCFNLVPLLMILYKSISIAPLLLRCFPFAMLFILLSDYLHSDLSFSLLWYSPEISLVLVFFMYTDLFHVLSSFFSTFFFS